MFSLPANQFAGGNNAWAGEPFRNPFASYASASTPQNWRSVLEWCENLFIANGVYRMSQQRIVSYFLTEVQIGAVSTSDEVGDDERHQWGTYFNEQLDVLGAEMRMGMDEACYGSSFCTLHVPFKRYFWCPKCKKMMLSFKEATTNPKFRFKFSNYEFHLACPNSECKYTGAWDIDDKPQKDPDKLKLQLWNPKEIETLHDLDSGDVAYLRRIPQDYKNQIQQGKLFELERVSKQTLLAIKKNMLFRFAPGVMYAATAPGPSGLRLRGWGMPPLIYNSRQIWYVELLHRMNEAVAMDYVVPMRVISPDGGSGPGGADNLLKRGNLSDHKNEIFSMIRKHRQSPTSYHALPFPVQFQQFGGDANQLAPRELLDQGYDSLLNASGTPVDLYKGSLQLQVAPVAMRLFEAQHHVRVRNQNRFLRWLVERSAEILGWDAISARHQRVQHADDMQKQMMILQLATAGRVSESTALEVLGLKWRDERRTTMEEARYDQELQSKMQEEMDQSAFAQQVAKGQPAQPGQPGQPAQAGQPAAGGAAPGGMAIDPATGMPAAGASVSSMVPGPETPQTPQQVLETAEAIASQLLGLPRPQQISELRNLEQKNEVMHGQVLQKLRKIRRQASSQGGSVLMQQQFGVA